MRNMARILSLAGAALAVSVVGVQAVQAHGARHAKQAVVVKKKATVVKGFKAPPAMKAKATKVAAKGPGSCGTFKYWKGGSCLDARDKK